MLDDLTGKVALVTAASGGIGRAIAVALAEAGAAVAVNYRSREDAAQVTCEAIRRYGVRALAVKADCSRAPAVAQMHAAIEADLGPVDILVNNAGIVSDTPLADLTEADWDEMLAVNLKSAFLVTQQVLAGMRSRGWGRIIMISSVAAQTGGITGPHYAASKAGLLGLTHSYARHLVQRRHHRQRHFPGPDRDRHGDRQPQGQPGHDPDGPLRRPGRGGRGGRHAGQERLHHRPDHQRQRRLVYELVFL